MAGQTMLLQVIPLERDYPTATLSFQGLTLKLLILLLLSFTSLFQEQTSCRNGGDWKSKTVGIAKGLWISSCLSRFTMSKEEPPNLKMDC